MTFDARETSRYKGKPVNLFLFRYGVQAGDVYGYTDGETAITYNAGDGSGAVVYTPIPIGRGEVTASGTLDKSILEVEVPDTSAIATLFATYPPSVVVILTIFQGHIGDSQYFVHWVGRVIGRALNDNKAIFSCSPASTGLKRAGLRRNYQLGCPHVLYGPQCKANRAAATITKTITGVNGSFIQMAAAWDTAGRRPKYVGGIAEWTRADGRVEMRSILRIDDPISVLLSGAVQGLTPGMSIKLSLGCNHKAGLTDDCIALHNNILNYGGQPFIPLKSPFGFTNNYY